jgi:hypothetical protein
VAAALLAFLNNQPPDLLQILRANSTPPNDEFSCHGPLAYTLQQETPEISSLHSKILLAAKNVYSL